jgi:hypothetical protein
MKSGRKIIPLVENSLPKRSGHYSIDSKYLKFSTVSRGKISLNMRIPYEIVSDFDTILSKELIQKKHSLLTTNLQHHTILVPIEYNIDKGVRIRIDCQIEVRSMITRQKFNDDHLIIQWNQCLCLIYKKSKVPAKFIGCFFRDHERLTLFLMCLELDLLNEDEIIKFLIEDMNTHLAFLIPPHKILHFCDINFFDNVTKKYEKVLICFYPNVIARIIISYF